MLRSQSILIAKSIADTLSDEGMELVPKAGTPIAFLNAAMASFPYDENKDDDQLVVEKMSMPGPMFDQHTGELAGVIKVMSKKTAGLHKFVQNNINPMIKKIVNGYATDKAHLENELPVKFKTVPVNFHPVYEDWKLAEILEPWEDDLFKGEISIPEEFMQAVAAYVTPDSFKETCKSGSETLDNFIAAEVERMDGMPHYTWFKQIASPGFISDSFLESRDLLDMMFIRGLLNGRLPDFPADSIDSTMRGKLVTAMRVKAQQVINRMKRCISFMEDIGERFVMDVKDNTVFAYHPNYQKWLEGEGSIEALTASFVANGVNVAAVNAAYESPKRWNDHFTVLAGQKKGLDMAKSKGLIEGSVSSELTRWINAKEDLTAEQRTELHQRLAKQIEAAPYSVSRDAHDWVRETVCKVIASDLLAFELLSTMEAYMNEGEDVDVEDAAIYATAFIMAKWVATQVEVVKSKKSMFNL